MIAAISARILIATLGLLAVATSASADFFDGNKLVLHMREYEKAERGDRGTQWERSGQYMGYVVGVHDAAEGVLVCSPANATVGQVAAIVAKYLNAHPEEWSRPAHFLVTVALMSAFPCPPSDPRGPKGTK